MESDKALIKALMDSFAAAFNSGDIDTIMKNYVPGKSFVIFDVVPRKDYRGADNYREYWLEMFSHFQSKPHIEISDLEITADRKVGFGHSFQHVTGIDKQGKKIDRTVRVTDGYQKIEGTWLIALEHVSVPVDLKTGMASFTL